MEEVSVIEMMKCREDRALIQKELVEESKCIISFCMNIAGPIKTDEDILFAFNEGKKEILAKLKENNIEIKKEKEVHQKTGDELFLALDYEPLRVKKMMSEIEDEHPLGRLFDIDVLDSECNKLSRNKYRKCLICDNQAQDCARSRRHSVSELFSKSKSIIEEYKTSNV